jgi:cell division protein FtsW
MAFKASSDRVLFVTATVLTVFGLVMVFSASSVVASSRHGDPMFFFVRQLAFAVGGYGLMLLLMNLDYHVFLRPKLLKALAVVSVIGLAAVFTQPAINGSHRWIQVPHLGTIQPSETAKLVLLFLVASMLEKGEKTINDLKSWIGPFGLAVGLFAGLTAAEPDLGQAVCMALIPCMLVFAAGLSWKYVAAVPAAIIPIFYFFVVRVEWRWKRFLVFLYPDLDPKGGGWQITQSLTAIGSGGWFGLGPGAGKQKLFYLPLAQSDFIYAIIGEELGLIGAAFVVVGFIIILVRGTRAALRAPDRFGYFLALGLTLMIVIQAFINISMVLAMMPTKGIALPFISQGGSSLFLNLMAVGILLNISHNAARS